MYTQNTTRLVLGEGETIGHKHVLESNSVIEYDRSTQRIKWLLQGTGLLTHDEHDRMVFDAGKYRSYHQREFNPMDGTESDVFD
jgi:hypothetical protein